MGRLWQGKGCAGVEGGLDRQVPSGEMSAVDDGLSMGAGGGLGAGCEVAVLLWRCLDRTRRDSVRMVVSHSKGFSFFANFFWEAVITVAAGFVLCGRHELLQAAMAPA